MVVKESRAGRGCCGGTLLGHSQVTSCCWAWCLVFKLEIVRVRLKCINTGKELATGLAAELSTQVGQDYRHEGRNLTCQDASEG